MGERYDAYFRQRLASFSTERVASRVPFADEAERIVVEGMRQLDLPSPYTIRPEAVYFLVVSLHEMILGPVAAVDEPELVRIRGVLPEDVVTILSEALRHVAARSDTDITGHDVADAISATWPRLASTSSINWEE
jgi:hypothetical protein